MLRKFLVPVWWSALIVLLASSLALAYSTYFYVIPTSAPLRECASSDCDVLLTAYQGDKVEILERTSTGWSRVRLVDRTGIGWIRSDWLSYSPDLKAKPVSPYHVNTSSLPLMQHPDPDSKVLKMLHFNDQVEMLGTSSGYAQVRDLESSIVGWVQPRYLSAEAADTPRSPRRRRPPRKAPPPEEKAPASPSAM